MSAFIVDELSKPPALEGAVEYQIRSPAGTVQINRYRWNESRQAIFKPDTPIIDIVLHRRRAELRGTFLEARHLAPEPVGDILFMPPNYTFQSNWADGERRSMCCVFANRDLADFFEFDWADHKLAASLNIGNGSIRGMMMRLVEEALSPGFGSEMLVESLTTALAVELRRHFDILDPEQACGTAGLSKAQLRRVREALHDEDATHPVTVAELARRERLSVRHFARLFRASTGRPVSDYAAEIRIERAKALLADETMMVKEIAFRCGFQNCSSFSSAFRKATHLTPQQYRSSRVH